MANLNFYRPITVGEDMSPYSADINIEVTIDISKYFDKEDFCQDGYVFKAPSGRKFYYGYTKGGTPPFISNKRVGFAPNSTKVTDTYFHADITSLAEDIHAFYEYLKQEKENKKIIAKTIAKGMRNTRVAMITLSLNSIIPKNFTGRTLPDFVSSNGICFYYDTHPSISPVIAKEQVWFDGIEISDFINEDEDFNIDEISKGFNEYRSFLKGYFAAKAEKND